MRIAAMAALLAVANGSAHAGWDDRTASRERDAALSGSRSGTVDLYQGPPSAQAWRDAQARASRDRANAIGGGSTTDGRSGLRGGGV